MSSPPCSSAVGCFYYGTNLASTTALSIVSIRLFREPDPIPRVMVPFTVALTAKIASLATYYFSNDVFQNHPDPIAGAGYPGLFALATGWVSKRITGTRIDISDTALVFLSTVINAGKEWVSREFSVKNFCDSYNKNKPESITGTETSASLIAGLNGFAYGLIGAMGAVVMVDGLDECTDADAKYIKRLGVLMLTSLTTANVLSQLNTPRGFNVYRSMIIHEMPFFLGMTVGYFYNRYLFYKLKWGLFYPGETDTTCISIIPLFLNLFLNIWGSFLFCTVRG